MLARPVTGVILAGGRATRFGGAPKGLARVGGERIVDRIARALRPACDELLLVANDEDARAWLPDVRVVRDVRPALGALGGLHTALTHAPDAALVVAWDMPFVTSALLRELRDRERADVDAVVPRGPDGAEPLCALYTRACLGAAERLLDAGERRARALAESVRTAWLDADEVARHGDPAVLLLSVNTPEDLAAAESLSRDEGRIV
ncbi:Molybdopterin-guanine dinucleotide biosynthesis protein A (plasmid) [Gemmatirosa kalamazoonensis]|uniref:Probable molybdenum cofactor guanylyltransferase n=1 Tax=Gemmatirosa kalamazoonensis TaxID=861299 RepID=W0RRN0_9BACT|nr:molybdenum cofactor guanylyltransferase [Gemmatirosa kalamazoonensis]AHG93122.1 Molybdopterin-guanine dinucleotide biosynthesis protein A [Gemmatirosa kalamazoonensis]